MSAIFSNMTTLLPYIALAIMSGVLGALLMYQRLEAMVNLGVQRILAEQRVKKPDSAVMKSIVAKALSETDRVKAEAAVRFARDLAHSKAGGDPEAVLRRISRIMDVQTWPNNSDLAGCVETMMQQYRSNMEENANLRQRIQLIESVGA